MAAWLKKRLKKCLKDHTKSDSHAWTLSSQISVQKKSHAKKAALASCAAQSGGSENGLLASVITAKSGSHLPR